MKKQLLMFKAKLLLIYKVFIAYWQTCLTIEQFLAQLAPIIEKQKHPTNKTALPEMITNHVQEYYVLEAAEINKLVSIRKLLSANDEAYYTMGINGLAEMLGDVFLANANALILALSNYANNEYKLSHNTFFTIEVIPHPNSDYTHLHIIVVCCGEVLFAMCRDFKKEEVTPAYYRNIMQNAISIALKMRNKESRIISWKTVKQAATKHEG